MRYTQETPSRSVPRHASISVPRSTPSSIHSYGNTWGLIYPVLRMSARGGRDGLRKKRYVFVHGTGSFKNSFREICHSKKPGFSCFFLFFFLPPFFSFPSCFSTELPFSDTRRKALPSSSSSAGRGPRFIINQVSPWPGDKGGSLFRTADVPPCATLAGWK